MEIQSAKYPLITFQLYVGHQKESKLFVVNLMVVFNILILRATVKIIYLFLNR